MTLSLSIAVRDREPEAEMLWLSAMLLDAFAQCLGRPSFLALIQCEPKSNAHCSNLRKHGHMVGLRAKR